MRLIATALAGAGLALALTAAPASAQSYGLLRDHCVGSRIASHNIVNKKGAVLGHTELWYSSISGGQNCVMTYNKGGSPWTRARIWRKEAPGAPGFASGDEGYYSIYAGGSYVNNADGRCVVWGGSIGDFYWYSNPDGVHCG